MFLITDVYTSFSLLYRLKKTNEYPNENIKTTSVNLIDFTEETDKELSREKFKQQRNQIPKLCGEITPQSLNIAFKEEKIIQFENLINFDQGPSHIAQNQVEQDSFWSILDKADTNIKAYGSVTNEIRCKTPGCKIELHKTLGPLTTNGRDFQRPSSTSFESPFMLPSIWVSDSKAIAELQNKIINQELIQVSKYLLSHLSILARISVVENGHPFHTLSL